MFISIFNYARFSIDISSTDNQDFVTYAYYFRFDADYSSCLASETPTRVANLGLAIHRRSKVDHQLLYANAV